MRTSDRAAGAWGIPLPETATIGRRAESLAAVRRRRVGLGAGVAVLASLPVVLSTAGPAYAACYGLIMALAVLSLSVLAWIGQISLAGPALMGLGVVALDLFLAAGAPFVLAGAGAVVVSVPVSLMLAAFLRVPGAAFGIGTLAFAYVAHRVVLQTWAGDRGIFGGVNSRALERPDLLRTDLALYYAILVSVVVAFVVCDRVRRSWVGTALAALRESETAFVVLGHRPGLYRAGVVCFSGALAALAGVWFATLQLLVPPGLFSPGMALAHLAYAVVGGLGSAAGAIAAGFLFAAAPRYIDAASAGTAGSALEFVAGLAAIVALRWVPGGLAEVAHRLRRGWERRAGAKPAGSATPGHCG